eukprot:CAMPEP_0179002488 /NCGR_PEP_ID=MMETSP0795-20121207/12049_1 /TAXON_ID=88552 /ORGANISM="Amoebophrya sp., Strain Ameob2" /LENGTH=44 /DNA_ID= /DNA_START= /DNA_END= /DNA_ORIENTATION=
MMIICLLLLAVHDVRFRHPLRRVDAVFGVVVFGGRFAGLPELLV